MNSNIDFLSVWLETILFSSTEITDFSSQLSFFLANIKSEIWQIYVIWRHHCQSTRGSYLPLLIFSYKGISALYLLYGNNQDRKCWIKCCLIHKIFCCIYTHLVLEVGLRDLDNFFHNSYLYIENFCVYVTMT